MNIGFYGGRNGQDFSTKEIFKTKIALKEDLDKGWTSPIQVGEYVVISYGMPWDTTEYLRNRDSDLNTFERTYNSTLWRKVYREDTKEAVDEAEQIIHANGLGYELISSMTGNTPRISFTDYDETDGDNIIVLDADEFPDVSYDNTNVDDVKITFHLPQAQVMAAPTRDIIGPIEEPEVEIIDEDINHPYLHFSLPRATKFYYGSLLGKGSSSTTHTLTDSTFVDYAAGDYYVHEASGSIYLITEKSNETTCTFVYQASIQQPLPSILTIPVNPYAENAETGEYEPVEPNVTRSFIDNIKHEWQLRFRMPKNAEPLIEPTIIGPEAEPTESVVTATSEENITFKFDVPRGAKIYTGEEVSLDDTSADIGALQGDIYLNTFTGHVFKWDGTIWLKQEETLKGPVGDSLNIVKEYNLDAAVVGFENTLENVSNYIVNDMGADYEFSPDEIFSVNWNEESFEGVMITTSYWYYFAKRREDTEGVWGRVVLTGGIAELLLTEYPEDSDVQFDEKIYTASYINTLIGGEIENPDRETYSAKQIEDMLSWGVWGSYGQDTSDEGGAN